MSIVNLSKVIFDKITNELETERWYRRVWEGEWENCVNVSLNCNMIVKCWDTEIMLDLAGRKVFIDISDFEEIVIR